MATEEMLNWTNDIPKGTREVMEKALKHKSKQIKNILEIGCFHGTSIVGFLELLPKANAVCVDLWSNDVDSELSGIDFAKVERQFDTNTKEYFDRIEKIKGDSKKVLHDLLEQNRKFDVIYVDGSHTALDVHYDAILSWLLLNKNGLLIFDDYMWYYTNKDVLDIPYHAIQHFLKTYKGQYKIVYMGYRVYIQKL